MREEKERENPPTLMPILLPVKDRGKGGWVKASHRVMQLEESLAGLWGLLSTQRSLLSPGTGVWRYCGHAVIGWEQPSGSMASAMMGLEYSSGSPQLTTLPIAAGL